MESLRTSDLFSWQCKVVTMASNSVLLALNSLSHDGMVHLTADYEHLGAVVGDFFATSDGSDDDSSGSDDDMECGK